MEGRRQQGQRGETAAARSGDKVVPFKLQAARLTGLGRGSGRGASWFSC